MENKPHDARANCPCFYTPMSTRAAGGAPHDPRRRRRRVDLRARVNEMLAERSTLVKLDAVSLKLTLNDKLLRKPFDQAVLSPFLKAYAKRRARSHARPDLLRQGGRRDTWRPEHRRVHRATDDRGS